MIPRKLGLLYAVTLAAVFWLGFVVYYALQMQMPVPGPSEILPEQRSFRREREEGKPEEAAATETPTREIKGCEWIRNRLHNPIDIPGSRPLPKSGKRNTDGNVFWLKSPEMHTKNPETGEEIMILKYNIYNRDPSWTQHTEKYENTVSVLSEHRSETFLPRLHAHCRDIDGYHYIAVEYISKHMNEVPKPEGLPACVDRAIDIMTMFSTMDDKGLCMMDMKPGQWMVRDDGTFVIQDVDDIVASPTKVVYKDQAEGLMATVQRFNRLSAREIDKLWKLRMFPGKQFNIRYAVMSFSMIMNDLGFQWSSRRCAGSAESTVDYDTFHTCRKKLEAWSMSVGDDWPTPTQLISGLKSCRADGTFQRNARDEKPWHALPAGDEANYRPPSACVRAYDNKQSGGRTFTKCEGSCCRNKGSNKCYYTAKASMCS